MSSLLPSWAGESPLLTIGSTVAATIAVLSLTRSLLSPSTAGSKLLNPLKVSLSKTQRDEMRQLVYHPDSFPGARDVETPYGAIRVYEFGPEDGEKVLFVHGITTSCVTLLRVAYSLRDRGYRVMLFDLFGRGFSDGVGDLPHDTRLYSSQILHVLASSPLSWTGKEAFHLIGYSLGGGIAVNFSRYHPGMLKTLVLLAPAGLISPQSFGRASRFLFTSGLVPEGLLAWATRRRLQRPIAAEQPRKEKSDDGGAGVVNLDPPEISMAAAEAGAPARNKDAWDVSPLESRVLQHVQWMVNHHAGFVPAFMSCIRHAPLTEQHESWGFLSKRKPGTTLMLFARDDEIIDWTDYERVALPLAGGVDNVRWRICDGQHDFPMSHHRDIVKELDDFWAR